MITAAIAGFVILIYAGFRYLTSTGNPVVMKDAVSKITSATIGLILLLGIHLIIVTIWGQEKLPEPTASDPVSGIYLEAGEDKWHYQDPISKIPEEITHFTFIGPSEEIYSVFLYKKENFQGTAFEEIKNDGGTHLLNGARSLKIKFNEPGIYVKGAGLGQEVLLQHNVSNFTFTPEVTEVVVNNKKSEVVDTGDYYTVLHQKSLFLGGCQIISATTSNIYIQPNSVSVFRREKNPDPNAQIIVYPSPNYQDKYLPTPDETIEHKAYSPGEASKPTALPDELKENIKSIKVPPGFAVILFEKQPTGSGDNIYTNIDEKCQIFYKNDPDLDDDDIGKCKGEQMAGSSVSWQIPCTNYIMIIPIE
jgi:hypothetical protein